MERGRMARGTEGVPIMKKGQGEEVRNYRGLTNKIRRC